MPQEFELGDDGEFAEAVDTRFGVYSARRKARHFPLFLALSSIFACAILFAAIYFSTV